MGVDTDKYGHVAVALDGIGARLGAMFVSMAEYRPSRTAVLVCQGRAAAHGRIAPGRFADPTATPLLRRHERDQVDLVRRQTPPKDMASRLAYEMVRAAAEAIVPRTVAIDDAVLAHPNPQLVILGAGLDGRAWRMPVEAVFEVDQPASQTDKKDRAAALPTAQAPRFVPVDFGRDELGDALSAAGHRSDTPTTWIWEGVVPYLTRPEVTATVAAVSACSAPGNRMIVNYQAPSLLATVGRRVIGMMLRAAHRPDPWSTEPWRSTWTATTMAALLTEHGFTFREDQDMLAAATTLAIPVTQPGTLRNSRVATADRA
jgi:methyltransferase (TIGR00027 family)